MSIDSIKTTARMGSPYEYRNPVKGDNKQRDNVPCQPEAWRSFSADEILANNNKAAIDMARYQRIINEEEDVARELSGIIDFHEETLRNGNTYRTDYHSPDGQLMRYYQVDPKTNKAVTKVVTDDILGRITSMTLNYDKDPSEHITLYYDEKNQLKKK